jgi:hypothetical protein
LTTEVLRQLDFTPYADEVLEKIEADVTQGKLEELQRTRAEATTEESIRKWQSLLQTCVDSETGQVDRDKESFYWDQIRNFLRNLPHNWMNCPGRLRNRLLKLIIDRMELYHNKERIEATIIWKVGFKQGVTIHRPLARGRRDAYWTAEEDRLLRMLYPCSPANVILAALPKRSWKAITERAFRLHLSRQRTQDHSALRVDRRPWTPEEDERLKLLYEAGEPLSQLSMALNRTVDAVQNRATAKRSASRQIKGNTPR